MSDNKPKLHLVREDEAEKSDATKVGRRGYMTTFIDDIDEPNSHSKRCLEKISTPDCHKMLNQICEILNKKDPEVVESNESDTIVIWKYNEGTEDELNIFKNAREALREALKLAYSKL